jgi:hypothetical protein
MALTKLILDMMQTPTSGVLGGTNSSVAHQNSFIIGSNITTTASGTLFVNSLSASGFLYGDGSNLTNLDAGDFTQGTLSNARLSASASFTTSVSAPALSGTHYGDGSNLSSLNATNINSGTLNNSRLPAVASFTTSVSTASLSAAYLFGDGSNLSSLNATNINSGTLSNARLSASATFTTSVSSPSISAAYLFGNASNLTGLPATYTPPANATFTSSVSAPTLSGIHYGDGSNLSSLNATNISSGTLNNSRLPAVATFTTSVSAPSLSGTHYGDGSKLTNVIASGGTATDATKLPLTGGTITGAVNIQNTLTVNSISVSSLTLAGSATFVNTLITTTSSLSVVNTSPVSGFPALYVGQSGPSDIASFYDIDQNIEVLHVGGVNSLFPNVGIKTSNPNKTLTVSGEISASGNISISGSYYGDGSKLTGVAGTYTPPANATFTSSVSAPTLSGIHYGDGSNLSSLNATNISSGTLNNSRLPTVATFTTSVSAPSLSGTHYGDGSKLTGIAATYIPPANATFTSSVSAPALSGTFYGDGSKLTGLLGNTIYNSVSGNYGTDETFVIASGAGIYYSNKSYTNWQYSNAGYYTSIYNLQSATNTFKYVNGTFYSPVYNYYFGYFYTSINGLDWNYFFTSDGVGNFDLSSSYIRNESAVLNSTILELAGNSFYRSTSPQNRIKIIYFDNIKNTYSDISFNGILSLNKQFITTAYVPSISSQLVFTSKDGIVWNSSTISFTPSTSNIIYSKNGKMAYCQGNYATILSGGEICTSTDLINWNINQNSNLISYVTGMPTGRDFTISNYIDSVFGDFLLVTAPKTNVYGVNNPLNSPLIYSLDLGTSWSGAFGAADYFGNYGIYATYKDNNGALYLAGENGLLARMGYVSYPNNPNTSSFGPVTLNGNRYSGYSPKNIVYGGGYYISINDPDNVVLSSTDKINWTPLSINNLIDTITYDSTLLKFIAYGKTLNNVVLISTSPSLSVVEYGTNFNFGVNKIVNANGKYFAVGNSGEVATSTDCMTWTLQTGTAFNTSYKIYDVAYGNSKYILAGGSGNISYSTDSTTWTQTTAVEALGFDITNISYSLSANNGSFIATTNNGSYGSILGTYDGIKWYNRSQITNGLYTGNIAYNGSIYVNAGGLYAYTTNGTSHISVSNNGLDWSYVNSIPTTVGFANVIYAASKFVAISTNGEIVTSTDGINWTLRTSNLPSHNGYYGIGLCYSSIVGKFLATSGTTYATSTDGITWSTYTGPLLPYPSVTVDQVTGKFYVASSTQISSSADGTTWSTAVGHGATVNNSNINTLAANNGIVVIASSSNAIRYSTNSGTTWAAAIKTGQSTYIQSIIYAGNTFAYIDINGTYGFSTDGNYWYSPVVSQNSIYSTAYGAGVYVSAGAFGGGLLCHSKDGINWCNIINVTAAIYYKVIYANGLFVAVGYTGKILTSPDGITWTSRTTNVTWVIYDIIYANGFFLAVGASAYCLYSTDGVTWTINSIGSYPAVYMLNFYNNKIYIYPSRNGVYSTTDGVTFTQESTTTLNIGIAAASQNISSNGNTLGSTLFCNGYVSTDGINWSLKLNQTVSFNCYVNGKFFAATAAGVYYSTDNGNTWYSTGDMKGYLLSLKYITYANNKFIAFKASTPYNFYSLDGINWIYQDTTLINNFTTPYQLNYINNKLYINARYSKTYVTDLSSNYKMIGTQYSTTYTSPICANSLKTIDNAFYIVDKNSKLHYSVDGIEWSYLYTTVKSTSSNGAVFPIKMSNYFYNLNSSGNLYIYYPNNRYPSKNNPRWVLQSTNTVYDHLNTAQTFTTVSQGNNEILYGGNAGQLLTVVGNISTTSNAGFGYDTITYTDLNPKSIPYTIFAIGGHVIKTKAETKNSYGVSTYVRENSLSYNELTDVPLPTNPNYVDGQLTVNSAVSASKFYGDGSGLYSPINSSKTGTYILSSTDTGSVISFNSASACYLQLPDDTVSILNGSQFLVLQEGTGTVTIQIVPGSSATVQSFGSKYTTAGQYAMATIVKTASNTYRVGGALA